MRKWWEQRDLNPHQRVSTTGGATPREISESSLQLVINCQQTLPITLNNWSPPVYQVSLYSHGKWPYSGHFLRNFAALFLLLIFFLRHFQR